MGFLKSSSNCGGLSILKSFLRHPMSTQENTHMAVFRWSNRSHFRGYSSSIKFKTHRQMDAKQLNGVHGKSGSMGLDVLYITLLGIATNAFSLYVISHLGTLTLHSALSSKDKFRVLVLNRGEINDPIDCRLEHVSSFHEVEYDAISYAWGDPLVKRERIQCNGQLLLIQPNLAHALKRLRYSNRERILWADAICINQNDHRERADQVSLMREIYANARQVFIWLGEEGDRVSDGLAFPFLRWLSKRFDRRGSEWQDTSTELGPTGSSWAEIKTKEWLNFSSVANLLQRAWFNRTWVVQELASSQSAILMEGQDQLPWDVFSDVLTKLRHPSFMVDGMEEKETQAALNSIQAMESARRSVNGTFDLSLFQILLATCSNACSDPRDKIYAVLGLAKDWLEKGGLDPDYDHRTTVKDVYRRYAMWDVKKNGQIRILSCTNGSDGSTDLPSWVPDWRRIENPRPFVLYSGRTTFSASGEQSVEAWFSDHGQTLHTVGEVVDSIETVGSQPRFCKVLQTDKYARMAGCLVDLASWLMECHSQASNGGRTLSNGRYEQFWQTMTCELTGDALPVTAEYGEYFRKYWDFIKSKTEGVSATLPSPTPKWELDDPKLLTHTIIESSLGNWASKRRFCTTTSGRLACMPPASQKGDLVCLLYGGEVPYLLRPTENGSYTVVGECYVNGIMHGEALSGDISRLYHFRIV